MPSEDRKEVVEAYEKLAKKHGLPPLEEFEEEFGFRAQLPVLSAMLNIVQDKIWQVGGHLETIITPQRVLDFIESGFYSEKEHEELYLFYKEISAVLHECGLSRWKGEAEKAGAIKALLGFYNKNLKPFALKFHEEHAKRWKVEANKKEKPYKHQSYHQ